MKNTNIILIAVFITAISGTFIACNDASLTDSRDGQKYKTVKIGDQVWMAENLKFKTDESNCYEDSEDNCSKLGRLYSWKDAKRACPNGWHLPSEQEFQKLLDFTIGEKQSYSMLADNSLWNGKNSSGFSAIPAGAKTFNGYIGKGSMALFWSSSQSSVGYARSLSFLGEMSFLSPEDYYNKYSVRCIQGDEPEKTLSKFEQKLADDIEYFFQSYKKLQAAFFSETGYFGDFSHIGYVPPQTDENFEIDKDDSRLILKLKGDFGDCVQSKAIWYIQEVATDTGACFNVVRPNSSACSVLTPNLCKNLSSEGKCGQFCIPSKNKPKQIVIEEKTSEDEVDVICDEEECF